MPAPPKILLLDDEQDFLELFEEILSQLPSCPDIHSCKSGPDALSLLESESFTLLLSDLHMPKMDGLEVLSLVRRKYPELRIVVMTAVVDEVARGRAYALGVDLFWQKPSNNLEVQLFQDCIESLLGRAEGRASTPVRSRSIHDVLRWECVARHSSRVQFTQGKREASVWISEGEVIDAQVGEVTGEVALRELLAWGTAEFQTVPLAQRARAIFLPYQQLLSEEPVSREEPPAAPRIREAVLTAETAAAEPDAVEFVLSVPEVKRLNAEAPAPSNPEELATWMLQTTRAFQELGNKLNAGELKQLEGLGPDRHVAVALHGEFTVCAGFHRTLQVEQVRATLKQLVQKWVS